MAPVSIHYRIKKLKDYLALKTEMVNHQAVIREVAGGVEHSWIYYLMLIAAGLIALLGLLTNSVAVVIGAMLISPLMGPIISSGLALTIGDLRLARRAFRAIATSVFLTILVTALVTLLSPLKDPTAEILARVRPNIYDLFVAMLSGIVGAVALCTKRNYLITATGVAVATAVIPPLSVVGYGLGTAQPLLAGGGFLLFFTNFVAIVLTSDLVFFIMGFRTSHVEAAQYSPRTRLLVIGGLLGLISIPLIYTLVKDVQKINTSKRIERILQQHLNHPQVSRMTGFSYQRSTGVLQVRASVNTVKYITKSAEQRVETDLGAGFQMPVRLRLEQVIMASGSLPDQPAPPAKQKDTPAVIRSKAAQLTLRTEQELQTLLAPFTVREVWLGFTSDERPVRVNATLQRDWPVNADERLVLKRRLEHVLELPVEVTLQTAPLLPPLLLANDGSLLPASRSALDIIAQLPDGRDNYRYQLRGARHKALVQTKQYLTTSLGVPATLISSARIVARTGNADEVYLTITHRTESR